MNRIKSFLMAAVIIITSINFQGLAANAAENPEISSESMEAEAGKVISVPINISGNQGVMGFTIYITYDKEVFTPVEVTPSALLSNGIFQDSIETSGADSFQVTWAGDSDMNEDGELFSVSFRVAEYAKGNYNLKLSYGQPDTFNEKWEDVALECKDISVTVTSPVKNDVYLSCTDNQAAEAGGRMGIPVKIINNKGIKKLTFDLQYDTSVFSFEEAEYGLAEGGSVTQQEDGLQIELDGIDVSQEEGVLLVCFFSVGENVSGKYIFHMESEDVWALDFLVPVKAETESDKEVDKVTEKINHLDIVTAENVLDNAQSIQDARDAYENLDAEQKTQVPADVLKKLTDAETAYKNESAAEEVRKKINAIDEINADTILSKGLLIDEAWKAYDALNEDQKKLITEEELQKLKDAKALYDQVSSGGTSDAVAQAVAKINAIPTPVTYDETCKGVIDAARAAYDALSEEQKNQITADVLKKLTDAEAEYNRLAADNAAVQNVVNKINAIGTVVKTDECAAKIKDARTAYNALTEEQKKLVSAEVLKKLTDAESAYAALSKPIELPSDKPLDLPPEKQQQIDNIAEKLDVSKDTAPKIQAVADELGVPVETLLLTDDSFENSKSESDIKGSTFSMLQLKATKVAAKQVTLKWKKVKAADGYQIYGAFCGKGNKTTLTADIVKNSKTSFAVKKLLKGKEYRYIVRAYKVIDGQKITIAVSKTVHIVTSGGKYGNAKSVQVNKAKVQIKKGKTFQIKAKEVGANKPLKRHRALCYESSNPNVATVTKKGVIKGKSKGTCTIYAYAQNGVSKKIKVTVK